jgi:integrator complex subunit 3
MTQNTLFIYFVWIDFTELLMIPTPKRYLKLTIPIELESELLFVMENVKLGKQKRYQQWILKKHIVGADPDDFIVDIIRYICGVFHPSNILLQSDMVPRWVMIGWLLKCLKVRTTS